MIDFRTLVVLLHNGGRETTLLHRSVRNKLNQHVIGRGDDIAGWFVAAMHFNNSGVHRDSISDFHVVVNATVVILHVKALKLQRHLVVFWNCNTPNAFFIWVVFFGIVRGFQVAFLVYVEISTTYSCNSY